MKIGKKEKHKEKGAIIVFIVGILLFVAYTYWFHQTHSYSSLEESNKKAEVTFVKGKVSAVNNDEVEENADWYFDGAHQGEQRIEVEILEGEYKGEKVNIKNYLLTTNYMFLKEKDKVLLQISKTELNDDVYFEIYQYYRQSWIFVMTGVFMLLILLVGRKKGVKTILALGFALYAILFFTLPLIYHGKSPILISIITVISIIMVTLFLLNGWGKKTKSAMLSTILGVVMSGVIYLIFSKILHITGFNTEEAYSVLLLKTTFGLQIKDLLFASILIASLGAVMDVGMSISSALYEMMAVKPDMSKKQLFVSGMNIGQDMIGTMSNTLILAFVGTSFLTMIGIAMSGIHIRQLINSNYFCMELLQGLSATMSIVLSVPITSAVSVYFYGEDSL